MSNLSEDIINKYLTGQCSEEELVEVNAWMKESEENARQLFRMEEIYHLGKFNQYADRKQMARAEKQLYKKLDEEKRKQNKILRMHRWMKYAAMIAVILVIGGGSGYWLYQNGNNQHMMVAVANARYRERNHFTGWNQSLAEQFGNFKVSPRIFREST